MASSEQFIRSILEKAGIEVGGSRPWDILIHNDAFYGRVISQGTLGFGEAYMQGWWDCPNVDQLIFRLLQVDVLELMPKARDIALWVSLARAFLFNRQRSRAFEVGEKHYDIGNDLYSRMLDKRLIYSCGYWKDAETLDQAQEAKLDLICRKIGLEQGMRVLDIGSGWGGFLKFAAERYGIEGVGITVSREQRQYAEDSTQGLKLDFRLEDYHDTQGSFDRIVSVGMFEHVGYKNYRGYFEKAAQLLSDRGLSLLHTIGGNESVTHGDPWAEKYIFPNGMLPSMRQIAEGVEHLFVVEDWHNFGADYDKTLMAWHANFEAAWPDISQTYDEVFHRMWRYYLLSFAGVFRARRAQLWQVVLSKDGIPGGYQTIR
ncbi:MAG: cyclopropane fatty acyl phospholipid synthase [Hyphomicrobiaceae bacterium]|nr:cyclopropane fatty acyl phospholipid synthase [Hyphomicrobiaceae bacterium]MCC0024055.1 cyclopropane fatty acyl phospholipid synthase [Hyphomicrobiaceae bacterium]